MIETNCKRLRREGDGMGIPLGTLWFNCELTAYTDVSSSLGRQPCKNVYLKRFMRSNLATTITLHLRTLSADLSRDLKIIEHHGIEIIVNSETRPD